MKTRDDSATLRVTNLSSEARARLKKSISHLVKKSRVYTLV